MWLVDNTFIPAEYLNSPLHFPNISMVNGADWYYPLHAHDWFDTVFCTSGQGTLTVNNTTIPLVKGTAAVVKPNEFHQFYGEPGSNFEYCVLSFYGDDSNDIIRFFMDKGNCLTKFNSDSPFVMTNFQMMSDLFEKDMHLKEPFFYSICMQMVYYLQSLLSQHSSEIMARSDSLMDQVLQYISDHYRENLTLESVAAAFSLSVPHLSRCFRNAYQISVINYLIDYRLNIAKDYLTRTDLLVSQISHLVGYENISHFTRLFTKRIGCSPLECREKFRYMYTQGMPPLIQAEITKMQERKPL